MTGSTAPGPDPGWPNPLWFLIPGGHRLAMRRAPEGHPLVTFRLLFLSFASAIGLIGFVAWVITWDLERDSALVVPAAIALVVVGIATLALGVTVPERRSPNCSSPEELVGWFRTQFFLRIALGEIPALIAFAAVVVTDEWWLYPLGAAFTAVAFAKAAPTSRRLAIEDQRLLAAGCSESLSTLLRPPASG